jgi:signal transduction histidine kinase
MGRNGHSRRILIVDDNPAIHEDFRKILAGANLPDELGVPEAMLFGATAGTATRRITFEVDAARAGQEALEMVRLARAAGRPYAVAFVDVRMPPGWDGIETLTHVWQEDPRVQAVICTAYADYSWNQMLAALGRTDRLLVLKKPFDVVEVQQLACALSEKWTLMQRAQVTADQLREMVAEQTAALTRADGDLRQSQERYREAHDETERLLAALSSILIEINERDQVTRWNAVAETTLGSAVHPTIGQSLLDCSALLDRPAVAAGIARCRAAGIPVRLDDLRYVRPDGRPGFLGLTLHPAKDGEHNAGRVLILGQDISERRQLECQLAQAQKLESIGQLAAGIAHEINTPTQFVGDNTRFLQDAFTALRTLLSKYGALLAAAQDAPVNPNAIAEVEQAIKALELDYLLEEIPKAIAQSLEGVDRVAKIVRAMKDFSHPDSSEREETDLNHAVENTVTVARNEWKYVADVQLDLQPDLPPVMCLPGEINQVILNILVNAAHAIADVVGDGAGGKGTITIQTRQVGDGVEIRIRDTGTGIPEKIQARVFDPFFTTKEVGKGTGQGLAIAHHVVVQKHHGTLTFETAERQGTTFIIRLPLTAIPADQGEARESEPHPDC